MAKYICFMMVLWHSIFSSTNAFAVNPADLIRLKKAGVSDKVITEIIDSDAISRAIVSIDEIIEMKAAKIGDEVILKIIEQANAPVPELDRQDAADRQLKREIKRQEMKLDFAKKELDIARKHLSKLITNPEIIKLVKAGKISGEDYAAIIKYLKQYAAGEETKEYGDEGDIDIDIKKINK